MQRNVRVAVVPDERHAATWTKHPVQLRKRHVVSEPVEGLSNRDRVHAVVGKRYVLGRAAPRFGTGCGALQLRTHCVTRLDCDDTDGRVLATGEDFFELSGYREQDLLGRDVTEIVAAEPNPVAVALEWGVRRLGERVALKTRAGLEKTVFADLFPALDDDGGLLLALTPAR